MSVELTAEGRLRRDIKNENFVFRFVLSMTCTTIVEGFALEIRRRLGNAQINLAFRSACTNFAESSIKSYLSDSRKNQAPLRFLKELNGAFCHFSLEKALKIQK